MINMDTYLSLIKKRVYDNYNFEILNFKVEPESKEYGACHFKLNGLSIRSRTAKITPKKVGQFVTFWKRNGDNSIEPFHENDLIDLYIVNVKKDGAIGQFVFPKSILLKKGILSTDKKEGKRAFRVYPSWDIVKNKQAENTQKWQLAYFYELNDSINTDKIKKLYELV